mgnify:CR=1 FL=1
MAADSVDGVLGEDLMDRRPEQVRDFYSAAYPEIVSAGIDGPEQKDGKPVVVPTVTVAVTEGSAGLRTTVAGTTGLTAMFADSQIVSVMAIRCRRSW